MYLLSSNIFGGDPLAVTLTILGLIALVASAVAVGRSALVKAQLEALRGDRDDLNIRVGILEHENEILKRDLKEESGRRQTLERVITAQEEIKILGSKLDEHDKLAREINTNVIAIKKAVVTNA